jgi:hypothetical protein
LLFPSNVLVAVKCQVGIPRALKLTFGSANIQLPSKSRYGAGLISIGAGSMTIPSFFSTIHPSAFQVNPMIVQ